MPPKKKIKVDSSRNPSDDGNLESDCEIRNPIEQKSKTADEKKPKRKKNSSTDAENIKVTQVFQNKTSTEFHEQDFGNTSKTPDGKKWNTKVVTWNVDGLRAWIKVCEETYLQNSCPRNLISIYFIFRREGWITWNMKILIFFACKKQNVQNLNFLKKLWYQVITHTGVFQRQMAMLALVCIPR